jgi:hypothetical protein
MSKRPQDTSAEEPDGGNPPNRFRGEPGRGNHDSCKRAAVAHG